MVGVLLLSGSGCTEPGCAEGCAEDMSAGDGDARWITGVELLEGSRKVNFSCKPAL